VEEGGEAPRRVEPCGRQILPVFSPQDATVELVIPKDLEYLTLGVIICTGQADDRCLMLIVGPNDLLDQPSSGPR
jgi:hypothetical protein